MDKLRKIYNKVKYHKLREENKVKYLKDYVNELLILAGEFYTTLNKSDEIFCFETGFSHEWNSILYSMRMGARKGKMFYLIQNEALIGMVHSYLDGRSFEILRPRWNGNTWEGLWSIAGMNMRTGKITRFKKYEAVGV